MSVLGPTLGTRSASERRLGPRFVVFGLLVMLAVSGLGIRLFQLQVTQAAVLESLTEQRQTVEQPIPVARGIIYDRRGQPLVKNVPTFVLRVRPSEIALEQRDAVADSLARLLDVPTYTILERLDAHTGSQFDLVRIADVPTEIARVIAEDPDQFPGVHVDLEARREYLQGKLMSHVLGWTGRISGPEFERRRDDGYWPEDLIGKAGLEATYERVLRGEYGLQEVEVDGDGNEIRSPEVISPPTAGRSLELTIDLKTQKNAEKALRWAMNVIGVTRGVFLAMDPQNGQILAMVSLPGYDNNAFAQGISTAEYKRLLKDPDRPMLNLAINEQYPPGSTYKLVTGAGAIQDRKITASTPIRTRPFIQIGRWKYWDWNKKGFGVVNMNGGFGHSSDTYFFQLAGMLGIDRLAYWAHQFGFGTPTGVDLPGEVAGIVPTNAWKRRVLNQSYFTGELYQAGIGQGYDAVTPLQLLNAYAALANGGTLYKPQLVKSILDDDGVEVEKVEPEVIRKLDVDRSTLRAMRVASRRVVTVRHTYNLVDLPIVVAGKSGTAEFGLRDRQGRLPFHNWFAAFVPKDPRRSSADPLGTKAVSREDSDLVVLAFLNDTRTAGNAATEVVKYFLQLHYGLKIDLRQRWVLERANFYGG
jgi:penicillin-binding protein 2